MPYAHASLAGPSIAAAGALPFTGLSVAWLIVAGFTLAALGVALVHLVPKRES